MDFDGVKQPAYCSKNRFSPEEDRIILNHAKFGEDIDWINISKLLKNKTPRQCKDRWNNYINPNLSIEEWKPEDDDLLLEKYIEYGPRWKAFSLLFKNRSINNIRNRCMKLLKNQEYGIEEQNYFYVVKKAKKSNKTKHVIEDVGTVQNEPKLVDLLMEKVEDDIQKWDPFNSFNLEIEVSCSWFDV